jgi:hypothetical protein
MRKLGPIAVADLPKRIVLSETEALCRLVARSRELHMTLFSNLTRHTYRKLSRTRAFKAFLEDLGEAERTLNPLAHVRL